MQVYKYSYKYQVKFLSQDNAPYKHRPIQLCEDWPHVHCNVSVILVGIIEPLVKVRIVDHFFTADDHLWCLYAQPPSHFNTLLHVVGEGSEAPDLSVDGVAGVLGIQARS